MARPTKSGIDYFPLDVDFLQDKKFKLIKGEFGAVGILIILEIFCEIYRENGYYKKFDDDDWILVSEEVGSGCNANLVKEVVERSVMRGLFDETVRNQFQVLTSSGIQKRYLKAVETRQDIVFIKDFMLIDLEDISQSTRHRIRFNEYKKEINPNLFKINDSKLEINSQSKVKESKVKESKVKKNEPLDSDIILNSFSFSEKIKIIIEKWLQYKKEKGQTYKKTGLETLLDSIQSKVQEIGEDLVVENIDDCIAKNYAGIFYNKAANDKIQIKPQKADTYNKNMEFLANTDFNEVLNGQK